MRRVLCRLLWYPPSSERGGWGGLSCLGSFPAAPSLHCLLFHRNPPRCAVSFSLWHLLLTSPRAIHLFLGVLICPPFFYLSQLAFFCVCFACVFCVYFACALRFSRFFACGLHVFLAFCRACFLLMPLRVPRLCLTSCFFCPSRGSMVFAHRCLLQNRSTRCCSRSLPTWKACSRGPRGCRAR